MNRLQVQQTFAVVNHRWAPECCVGLALCQGCAQQEEPISPLPCIPTVLCCPEQHTSPVSPSQNSMERKKLPVSAEPQCPWQGWQVLIGVWVWKSESVSTGVKACDKCQSPGWIARLLKVLLVQIVIFRLKRNQFLCPNKWSVRKMG